MNRPPPRSCFDSGHDVDEEWPPLPAGLDRSAAVRVTRENEEGKKDRPCDNGKATETYKDTSKPTRLAIFSDHTQVKLNEISEKLLDYAQLNDRELDCALEYLMLKYDQPFTISKSACCRQVFSKIASGEQIDLNDSVLTGALFPKAVKSQHEQSILIPFYEGKRYLLALYEVSNNSFLTFTPCDEFENANCDLVTRARFYQYIAKRIDQSPNSSRETTYCAQELLIPGHMSSAFVLMIAEKLMKGDIEMAKRSLRDNLLEYSCTLGMEMKQVVETGTATEKRKRMNITSVCKSDQFAFPSTSPTAFSSFTPLMLDTVTAMEIEQWSTYNEQLETATLDSLLEKISTKYYHSDYVLASSRSTGECALEYDRHATIDHVQPDEYQIQNFYFINLNHENSQQWKKLLIPIQESGHFWLMVFERDTHILRVYDSLYSPHFHKCRSKALAIVNWYVNTLNFRPLINFNVVVEQVPKQKDGISCGAFVSYFCECLFKGVRITSNLDPHAFRSRVIAEYYPGISVQQAYQVMQNERKRAKRAAAEEADRKAKHEAGVVVPIKRIVKPKLINHPTRASAHAEWQKVMKGARMTTSEDLRAHIPSSNSFSLLSPEDNGKEIDSSDEHKRHETNNIVNAPKARRRKQLNKTADPKGSHFQPNASETIYTEDSSRPYNLYSDCEEDGDDSISAADSRSNAVSELSNDHRNISENTIDECLKTLRQGHEHIAISRCAAARMMRNTRNFSKSCLKGIRHCDLFEGDYSSTHSLLIPLCRENRSGIFWSFAIYKYSINKVMVVDHEFRGAMENKENIEHTIVNVIKIFMRNTRAEKVHFYYPLCHQSKNFKESAFTMIFLAEKAVFDEPLEFRNFNSVKYKQSLLRRMNGRRHVRNYATKFSKPESFFSDTMKKAIETKMDLEKTIKELKNPRSRLSLSSALTCVNLLTANSSDILLCDYDSLQKFPRDFTNAMLPKILLFVTRDKTRDQSILFVYYVHDNAIVILDSKIQDDISHYILITAPVANFSKQINANSASISLGICTQSRISDKMNSELHVCAYCKCVVDGQSSFVHKYTPQEVKNTCLSICLKSPASASLEIQRFTRETVQKTQPIRLQSSHKSSFPPTTPFRIINSKRAKNITDPPDGDSPPSKRKRPRCAAPSETKEKSIIKEEVESGRNFTARSVEYFTNIILRESGHKEEVLLSRVSHFDRRRNMDKQTTNLSDVLCNWNPQQASKYKRISFIASHARKKRAHYIFIGYDSETNECTICDSSVIGSAKAYELFQNYANKVITLVFTPTTNVTYAFPGNVQQCPKGDYCNSALYAIRFMKTFVEKNYCYSYNDFTPTEYRNELCSKLIPATPIRSAIKRKISKTFPVSKQSRVRRNLFDTSNTRRLIRKMQIYESSITTLEENMWLNDEVVEGALRHIVKDVTANIVPTTEFEHFRKRGKVRDNRWKDDEVTDIFLPIHYNENHWILCHVDITLTSGKIYDSLLNVDRKFIAAIRAFVNALFGQRISVHNAQPENVTMQRDSHNCGVHVIYHAHQIVNEQPTGNPNFNANEFRNEIKRMLRASDAIQIVQDPVNNDVPSDTSLLLKMRTMSLSAPSGRLPKPRACKKPVKVEPELVRAAKYLHDNGWSPESHDDATMKPFKIDGRLLAKLKGRSMLDQNLINFAFQVMTKSTNHRKVVCLSSSDVEHFILNHQLNENLHKCERNLNSDFVFFAPYIHAGEWRICILNYMKSINFCTGYLYGRSEGLTDDDTGNMAALWKALYAYEDMPQIMLTSLPCSSRDGTGEAIHFCAHYSLLNQNIHEEEFLPRLWRNRMARECCTNALVQITDVPSEALKEVKTSVVEIDYTPPKMDSTDLSCLETSIMNIPVTEDAFNVFISKLTDSKYYYPLPTVAYNAHGPLRGMKPNRRQGLLIPVVKENGGCMLIVIKERQALIFDKSRQSVNESLRKNIQRMCAWYNKKRASCSHIKKYPLSLNCENSYLYVAALMYSFCKYGHNFVYNTHFLHVKKMMTCILENKEVNQHIIHEPDTRWEYLDIICRRTQNVRPFEGAFSETEEEAATQDLKQYLKQHKHKIRRDEGRAFRSNVLPDFFKLPDQVPCKHCAALYWEGYETPSVCCKNGCLDFKKEFLLHVPTVEMRKLKNDMHNCSSSMPYKILPRINQENAFAQRVVNFKPRSAFPRGGTIPLVLNGEYLVSPIALEPNDSHESRKFTCLNITNAGSAEVYEMTLPGKLSDDDKVEAKHFRECYRKLLTETHPFFQVYKTAHEVLNELKAKAKQEGTQVKNFFINIVDPSDSRALDDPAIRAKIKSSHIGTLNPPTTDHIIAYIYEYGDGEHPSHDKLNKGIRVYLKDGKNNKRHISHVSTIRDSALFPLLFPTGAQTYSRERQRKPNTNSRSKTKRTIASRSEFHNYIRCRRSPNNDPNHWLHGYGAVTAEYELQVACAIEADRMAAFKQVEMKMAKLMCTNPRKMDEFNRQRLNRLGFDVGVRLELSANYPGSRKNLENRYYSGMALARKYGNPDVFLTFTGNPAWEELEQLKISKHMDWQHMPDDVVRVFNAKFEELKRDLFVREVLGKVVYWLYSIEFQKRGMPHAHILIKLEEPLNTKEKIDKIISAEIPELPDPESSDYERVVRYKELIRKQMIHGPCEGSTTMLCRKNSNGQFCSKRYPMAYCDETAIKENGYPSYRRRNNGETIVFKSGTGIKVATNQHVVPHNPYLLMKYGAHINVEAITKVMNFRYLFKYIYKGFDELIVFMDDPLKYQDRGVTVRNPPKNADGTRGRSIVDFSEIDAFIKCRYMCPQYAAFMRRGYPMAKFSHKVMRFFTHLEGEHRAYYEECDDQETVQSKIDNSTSPFLEYMKLMAKEPKYRNLTFEEVCTQFKYENRKFVEYKYRRQIDKNVAYIVPVSPMNMELYALSALVRVRKGYRSFEELKTDPETNEVYHSFAEAARKMGIIEDDIEWDMCMKLATGTRNAHGCRVLYAAILTNCFPPDPRELWDKYKAYLLDPNPQNKYSEHELEQRALRHIRAMLKGKNKKYKDFKLPPIDKDEAIKRRMQMEEVEKARQAMHDMDRKLNHEQRILADNIIASIIDPSNTNRLFFVSGSGGCGKTFLYNFLINYCVANEHSVIPVATTGIAATLLKNGITAHSAFNIPLDAEIYKTPNLDITRGRGKKMAEAQVIIFDEAPMLDVAAFDFCERILRSASKTEDQKKPFGGKVVLLGGDWKQILPVLKNGMENCILQRTINNSEHFNLFEQHQLTQNMRLQQGQQEYLNYLEEMGRGESTDDGYHVKIKSKLIVSSRDTLIEAVFPKSMRSDPLAMSKRAILTVRNDVAVELNNKVFDLLPGKEEVFLSVSTPCTTSDNLGMPLDNQALIESINPSELPLHQMRLKKGCIVMDMRNIDVTSKLCNGTKLIVDDFIREGNYVLLKCRNLSDEKHATVFIPRILLKYENKSDGTCFQRKQFPVKLCSAMTINKSQGQTLDFVGLDMSTPCFSHGHLYVAFSRVRNENSIRVYAPAECLTIIPLSPSEAAAGKDDEYDTFIGGKPGDADNGMYYWKLRNVVYRELFACVGLTNTPVPMNALNGGTIYGHNEDTDAFDEWLDRDMEESIAKVEKEREKGEVLFVLEHMVDQISDKDEQQKNFLRASECHNARDNTNELQAILEMLEQDCVDAEPPKKKEKANGANAQADKPAEDEWDNVSEDEFANRNDDNTAEINNTTCQDYFNPEDEIGAVSTDEESLYDSDEYAAASESEED